MATFAVQEASCEGSIAPFALFERYVAGATNGSFWPAAAGR
ncbi:hypothetical protein N184_09280 [Sinorhizobium sp. GL28]|nr:hypothetical protein N184_09280 [Sinorhizobium sp. GL28]